MIHPLKYRGFTFTPDNITENDMVRGIEVTIHTQDNNKHVSMVLGKTFPKTLLSDLGVGIHPQVLPTLALIEIDRYIMEKQRTNYTELTKTYTVPFIMGLDYGVRFGVNGTLEDAYDAYIDNTYR